MLRINFKKLIWGIMLAMSFTAVVVPTSSILFATEAHAADSSESTKKAAMFGSLISAGAKIFVGLRDIIFAASGIGIVAVAIGGFFGNLNWKWLAAIGIGLFVLSTTAALIDYMVGADLRKSGVADIQGSLKSGT